MKEKFRDYYMSIADLTSKLSYAKRLQVGAVIVRDTKILGTGYNGTPSGWDNNCENKVWDTTAGGWLSPEEIEQQYPYEEYHPEAEQNVRYGLKTKPEVLHAESNALAKVARSTESSENAIMFCTHAPCIDCAKLIYQSGIKSVYYRDHYRNDDGLDFLKRGEINVHRYSKNGL